MKTWVYLEIGYMHIHDNLILWGLNAEMRNNYFFMMAICKNIFGFPRICFRICKRITAFREFVFEIVKIFSAFHKTFLFCVADKNKKVLQNQQFFANSKTDLRKAVNKQTMKKQITAFSRICF